MEHNERGSAADGVAASVVRGAGAVVSALISGYFEVECYGPDGKLKWRDTIHNKVTTAGINDMLDKYLEGSSYTATVYMGLKGTGTAAAGDTQASHSGWLEQGLANQPTYTGNRKTVAAADLAAASGGAKSTSTTFSFAITGTSTAVFGVFVNVGGSATKDDTTGTLFSAGDFTGGSKTVANGDTLNVTLWTITITPS